MNKAIFLDRDGTINVDKGYVYKSEDFEFIDRVPEAIKIMNDLGYLVIVITNQSGIVRGYYSIDDVNRLHKYIDLELSKYNAHIDAYYYCPHHPDFGEVCYCRKPKTGLIEQAVKDFNIDISKSWMVGDKESDMQCADNYNIQKAFLSSHNYINSNRIKRCYAYLDLYNFSKILKF